MPIESRVFTSIVTSLRQKFATTAPNFDTKEGTLTRTALIDPTALELEQVESLLLQVQESQSLLTARGVDLDLLAFNYNVQRRSSQSASGFVQFYIDQTLLVDPIVIAKNTIVTSTDNVQYKTLLEGVLNGFAQTVIRNSVEVYQITIPVVSVTNGSIGNAASNRLSNVNILNVNVTNDAPIEGGFEEEPDDSLAERCILSFGIWSRGTKKAVEFGARLVPGVYFARAVTDYAGHFTIFVSDQAGNLSDEMRQAVFDILVDWAGAGNGWSVVQPPLFLQNTTIKVIFKSKINMDQQVTQLQADVNTVINKSNNSVIYLDDLITDIKKQTENYVLHFDLDNPNEHVVQPVGSIIRGGSCTVFNNTV